MKRKTRLPVALTRHTVLLAFFVFLVFNSFAQKTITGTVMGPDKKPVVGASVIVKGTTVGTTTNEQGAFSIALPANRDVLLITYVEYEVNEVTVTGNTVNVTMKLRDVTQNEVVVTGYGTQRRRNVTGAISSINNKISAIIIGAKHIAHQTNNHSIGIRSSLNGLTCFTGICWSHIKKIF